MDITSHYLPVVSSFSSFWETHMKEDYGAPEYEVSEIIQLFVASNSRPPKNISEEFIIDLLKHIAPEVTIEDDKYIFNVACDIWDKKGEVSDFMIYATSIEDESSKNLSSLYAIYTSWKQSLRMSKNCFEKLVKDTHPSIETY